MAALDSARATSFGTFAEEYALWRPTYPDTAVDWLLPPSLDAGAHVADVGAGTGQLTGAAAVPRPAGLRGRARLRHADGAHPPAPGGGAAPRRGRGAAVRRRRPRTRYWSGPPGTGSRWTTRSPRYAGCCGPAGASAWCGTWSARSRTGSTSWPAPTRTARGRDHEAFARPRRSPTTRWRRPAAAVGLARQPRAVRRKPRHERGRAAPRRGRPRRRLDGRPPPSGGPASAPARPPSRSTTRRTACAGPWA